MSSIQLTRRAYFGTGTAVVAFLAIGLGGWLLLSGQGGKPPEPLNIAGVPRDQLEQANVFLTVPENDRPEVSPENAMAAVKALNLGEPASAVLARFKDQDAKAAVHRLAWVVVMNAATVPLPNKSTDFIDYTVHFVDAQTGEWFFAFGGAVSCGQTQETMAECARRGITPKEPGYPEEASITP